MTPDELREVALSLGMPAFTGKQMAQWLYQRHVRGIDEMTNLSKANRERLALDYCVGAMEPIDCQRSVDGTIKYLFPARRSRLSRNKLDPLCRDCLYPRRRAGHALRFIAGGVQNELSLLPDGQTGI